MLLLYFPQQTKFCLIDEKLVRGDMPSFTETEMSVGIGNPAYKAPESGNCRTFPFYLTGAGQVSSAILISCVIYPCFAPVFDSQRMDHNVAFIFRCRNNRINNITTRSRTEKSGANHDATAQSGAAALSDAVRCSATLVMNFGTPVVQNRTHDNLRLRLRRVVPFSDMHTPCREQLSSAKFFICTALILGGCSFRAVGESVHFCFTIINMT